MWTKKEVAEFKDSIRNEGGDSIIKVIRSNFAEAAFLQWMPVKSEINLLIKGIDNLLQYFYVV